MIMIFFIPLTLIALFESQLDTKKNKFFRSLFSAADEGEEDDPTRQDPQIDEDDEDGKRIVKVRFHELVKGFPDTTQVRFATDFRLSRYAYLIDLALSPRNPPLLKKSMLYNARWRNY
jgi:hypothetical protein